MKIKIIFFVVIELLLSNKLFCQDQIIRYDKYTCGFGMYTINNSINSKLSESNIQSGVGEQVALNLSYLTRPDYYTLEDDSSYSFISKKNIIYGVSLTVANTNKSYQFYQLSFIWGYNFQIYSPIYLNVLLGYNFSRENLIIHAKEDKISNLREIIINDNKSQKLISDKFLPSLAVGIDCVFTDDEETPVRKLLTNFGIGLQLEYLPNYNPENFVTNNGVEIDDLKSNVLNDFNFKINFVVFLTQKIKR